MLTKFEPQSCCKRDPVKTRETLLQQAFQQIHAHGFQSVSLDAILRDAGVTKGALYHHFPNKKALGYAVVDEVIGPMLTDLWITPVTQSDDPISALQQAIRHAGESMTVEELRLGCPLNNLSQEMSSQDEGFRTRLDLIYEQWRTNLSESFKKGIKNNKIKNNIDPDATVTFLIASLEGCIGMAKNAQSMQVLNACGAGILSYLESLRPAGVEG